MSDSQDRIYLDNAATSWPKPPQVLTAIKDFYQNLGSASGRGIQASPFSSDHLVRQCRTELAQFLGAGADDPLIFAFNGTDAINMAFGSFLKPGDHVVTTEIEHNSVIRPLEERVRSDRLSYSTVDSDENGFVNPKDIESAIRPQTQLVVVSHASNVTGSIQDVNEIGQICKRNNVAFMVDAAQTVGQIPIDFRMIDCDFLAAPGHKGLMGPLGTGFLIIRNRIAQELRTWRAGGTGTQSEMSTQPTVYPARLESGNLNVGGIAGLLAGLRFVQQTGLVEILRNENELCDALLQGLRLIPGIQVMARSSGQKTDGYVGVVSFLCDNLDSREISMILDASFGIQTRAGFHCSPGIHKRLGSFDLGGTIRVSPNWFTTLDQIDRFLVAIRQISESMIS